MYLEHVKCTIQEVKHSKEGTFLYFSLFSFLFLSLSLLKLFPGCWSKQYGPSEGCDEWEYDRFMTNWWVFTQIVQIVSCFLNGKWYRDHMGFPVLQRWYGGPYYSRGPCVNGIFHSAGRGGGGLATLRISSVFLCSIWWWIILRERGTFNKRHSCDSD